MKHILALLLLSLLPSMASCQSRQQLKADSRLTDRQVPVGTVQHLDCSVGVAVEYTQRAGAPEVRVCVPQNFLPYLKVEESGGRLRIYWDHHKVTLRGPKGKVYVAAPAVGRFEASSGADLLLTGVDLNREVLLSASSGGDIAAGSVRAVSLVMNASSGGDIDLDQAVAPTVSVDASSGADVVLAGVQATTVSATASSGAEVKLSGRARQAVYTASSAADIKAEALRAQSGVATASSAASVKCNISGAITVSKSTEGSVKNVAPREM